MTAGFMIWKCSSLTDDLHLLRELPILEDCKYRTDKDMKKILVSLMVAAVMCAAASCACSSNSEEVADKCPVEQCAAGDREVVCPEEKCPGCDSTAVKDSSYMRN